MLKRSLLGLALLFRAGVTLVAQDSLETAFELARKGQAAATEAACQKILRDPASPPEARTAVELVRAESLLAQALAQSDLRKLEELIDASVAPLQKFLKSHPSHSLAPDARRGVDWRRYKKAERVGSALKLEEDPRKKADLERRAQELYSGLEVHYQDRLRELRGGKGGAEAQVELMDVLLDLPRAMLEHARLPGLDDEKRKRLLAETVERLQDFQLDWFDNAAAFDAAWLEGQCHQDLGDQGTARLRFEAAIDLGARLAEARKEPNEYCLGVMRGARVSLADMLLKAGQHREAMAFIDRTLKDDSDLKERDAGKLLQLLKAECLFQAEDLSAALELAAQVEKADPEGKLGAAAHEKIRAWSSDARMKGSLGGPERLLAAADALLEREQWSGALQSLRRALEASETAEDGARYRPEALYKAGQCLARMGRGYEAVTAFQSVFTLFPTSELAPRACFEAVRALGSEIASTRDPGDEELKERLLARLARDWPDHPSTRNVAFLQAEKAERARDFRQAAELYRKVREDAEAYEASLVGAARSYLALAGAPGEKGQGDPAALKAEAKDALLRAEESLKGFFAALENPDRAPRAPDLVRLRESLKFLATQTLALVYTHEEMGRFADSLALLDGYAKALKPEDPRLGRIWALQIRAHLSLDQGEDAWRILDALLERFPESPGTIQAARSVAIHLQRASETLLREKGDPARIREHLKRTGRYYLKWLNESLARGQRVSLSDAISVSDVLYMAARRLNSLPDEVVSFLDLREGPVKDRQPFTDAAFVLTLLVEGKLGKVAEDDRLGLLARLARCHGFLALDAQDWQKVKALYSQLISASKLLDEGQAINLEALKTHPTILSLYIELGAVYFELARKGQKFQFENAMTVFQNVLRVTEGGSEPWWIARYLTLEVLFAKGTGSDVRVARTLLDNLEKNFPDYDGDRFRLKSRLLELKARLVKVTG